MPLYLLDTDAVIDLLKGFQPTVQLLDQLVAEGNLLATNTVIIAEVYSGLAPVQQPQVARFVDRLVYLPISAEMARDAGSLRFDARRRGTSLAITDTLIASTTLAHGACLVTGSVRHYPIPSLSVLPLPGRGPASSGGSTRSEH